MLECARSEERCGGYGIFYPFFPPPSPPPHLPFPPPTLLHTPTHFSTSPSTLSHSFHIPPYLSQLPKLLKISQFLHHPYSSKLPQIFYTPSFFPILLPPALPIVTLSFTPHQNFSFFSFIAKLIQQSNTLATPCKFHKKKFKNKNIK